MPQSAKYKEANDLLRGLVQHASQELKRIEQPLIRDGITTQVIKGDFATTAALCLGARLPTRESLRWVLTAAIVKNGLELSSDTPESPERAGQAARVVKKCTSLLGINA